MNINSIKERVSALGYSKKSGNDLSKELADNPISSEQVEAALKVIDQYLTRSDSFCRKFTSHTLKEIVQRISGTYISRGALIMAMLVAGFEVIENNDNPGLNDFFYNVQENSVWTMQKASQGL